MKREGDSLDALAKKANDLHSLLVKQSITHFGIGIILVMTLAKGAAQLGSAELVELKNNLQREVNISGLPLYKSNVCAWWDHIEVVPSQEMASLRADRDAAVERADLLVAKMQQTCAKTRPYVVEFKFLDYPINFDLQYWLVAIPVLFILSVGYLYRLWRQRKLVCWAGEQVYAATKSSPTASLDGVLLFNAAAKRPALDARIARLVETVLFASVVGIGCYSLALVTVILSDQIRSFLGWVVAKLFGAAITLLFCFLYDSSRRMRVDIEEWLGEPLAVKGRFGIARRVHSTSRFLRNAACAGGSRAWSLAGGLLGVATLFLASGMNGCNASHASEPVNGYKLLHFQSDVDWYFAHIPGNLWVRLLGRGTYALGVVLAATALMLVLASLFRSSVLDRGFRNSIFAYLVLFSVTFVTYELAWADQFGIFPWALGVYVGALVPCAILSSRHVRAWIGRRFVAEVRVYLHGLLAFTVLLAVYRSAHLIVERFWGVLAFALSQLLLLRCVVVASTPASSTDATKAEALAAGVAADPRL